MKPKQDKPRRLENVWIGTAILLVVTLGTALLGRGEPASRDLNLISALVIAAGTLGIASVVARRTDWPSWALYTTAGVMCAALIGGALFFGPSVWEQDVRPGAWMFPWFFLTFGYSRSSVACTSRPRTGLFLVAVGLLYAAILSAAPFLSDFFNSAGDLGNSGSSIWSAREI